MEQNVRKRYYLRCILLQFYAQYYSILFFLATLYHFFHFCIKMLQDRINWLIFYAVVNTPLTISSYKLLRSFTDFSYLDLSSLYTSFTMDSIAQFTLAQPFPNYTRSLINNDL